MKEETIIKAVITVIMAGLSAYLNILAIPLIILIAAMVGDYISGMSKAFIANELNSHAGIKGIVKKVSYLLVVCVGMCVDWIISAGLAQIGMEYQNNFYVGLIVTIWLIINELISILENLSIIGVPLPSFLTKLITKLKVTVENKSEVERKE